MLAHTGDIIEQTPVKRQLRLLEKFFQFSGGDSQNFRRKEGQQGISLYCQGLCCVAHSLGLSVAVIFILAHGCIEVNTLN